MRNHITALISRIIRKSKKLHTFDYIVLLGLLLIVGGFLFLRLSQRTAWINVSVKVQPEDLWYKADPEPWYAQAVALHEQAFNTFGQKVAEIQDIHTFESGDGRSEVLVDLTLKTSFDKRKHQFVFYYQPVLVGQPLEIDFGKFSVKGLTANINTTYRYVDKNIEVRLLAEFPWTVDALTKGLQAKDALGRVIVEIQDVSSQNAQTYEFIEKNGRRFVVQGEDPTRRDATIKLKVKAVEYNGLYYTLDGTPIKIGQSLHFQFPKVSIAWSVISAIYN